LTAWRKDGTFNPPLPAPLTLAEISIGPFVIDTASSRLRRDGAEIRLRPQAFQALEVLLKHAGRAVSYDQMIAEAWKGTHVSRHTVDVTVGEAKKTLGEYGHWITHRPKAGYRLEVPTSEELVRKGWHFLNRRTREGAERAIECFEHAAADCPTDARAFEGLSTCYIMLATFGMQPPDDVYPKFLETHERAVTLGGLRPELRCNRAHGLHLFEQQLPESEAEFAETIREKPSLGTAYVRVALLYATLGRLDASVEMLGKGAELDPLLPTLPATAVQVRFWRREFDLAIALGKQAVELHPYLQIGRVNYAQALEFSGRLGEALAQYQLASVMSPDLPWLRALEGTCLAKMGRAAEAHEILDELEHLRRSEYVDAYYAAVLRQALGHTPEAVAELERAVDENSAFLYSMNVDPKMDAFRRESVDLTAFCRRPTLTRR
jgi:DNA-binding winged helix-turn-helix (wHTH) protein